MQIRGFIKHLHPCASNDALCESALPKFPSIGNLLSWENPAASVSSACTGDSAKGGFYVASHFGGISLPSNTTWTHNHIISNAHGHRKTAKS